MMVEKEEREILCISFRFVKQFPFSKENATERKKE